jgi:hypothetical protein
VGLGRGGGAEEDPACLSELLRMRGGAPCVARGWPSADRGGGRAQRQCVCRPGLTVPQRLNMRYYIDFTHLLRFLLASGSIHPNSPNHSNNLNNPNNGAGCGQDTEGRNLNPNSKP